MDELAIQKEVAAVYKRWCELETQKLELTNKQHRLFVELSDKKISNYMIAGYWGWKVSQTTIGSWLRKGRANS